MTIENNLQLSAALDDYLYEMLAEIPTETSLSESIVLSSKFCRRMNRLVIKARRMENAQYRSAGRSAAGYAVTKPSSQRSGEDQGAYRIPDQWRKRLLLALVVMLVVISTCTVVAAREQISDFFITVYQKYTSYMFHIKDDTSESASQEGTGGPSVTLALDVKILVPSYIPKGFEKVDEISIAQYSHAVYVDSSGLEFCIDRNGADKVQISLDSEKMQAEEIMIGNHKAFYYANTGMQNLVWSDAEFVYLITGQISRDEMILIAESMYK